MEILPTLLLQRDRGKGLKRSRSSGNVGSKVPVEIEVLTYISSGKHINLYQIYTEIRINVRTIYVMRTIFVHNLSKFQWKQRFEPSFPVEILDLHFQWKNCPRRFVSKGGDEGGVPHQTNF